MSALGGRVASSIEELVDSEDYGSQMQDAKAIERVVHR